MTRLLLLALVSATLTLVGCGGSGPGDRVKEFHYAMEKGDADTVKEIAPPLAAMLSDEKIEEMVASAAEDAEKKGGIESITIDKETIDGDTAHVEATVTFGNGETEDGEFDLKKVDGEWVFVLDTEDKDDGPTIDLTPDTGDGDEEPTE